MNRDHLLKYALVIFTAAAVYANVYRNEFVYDDIGIILRNERLHSLSNPRAILLQPYWGEQDNTNAYRPLTLLSYALQYALSADHPAPYHLFNVLLHALNSALIFALTRRIARREALALATALLFATHPIHVEAVAGIVGRAELLSAACVLLALLLHGNGEKRAARNGRRIGLLFFAGLCAKESAVILPLLLLAYEWLLAPRVADWNALSPLRKLLRLLARHKLLALNLLAAFGVYFLLRAIAVREEIFQAQKSPPLLLNPVAALNAPLRPLAFLRVSALYLRHLIFPAQLSPDYSYDAIPLQFHWTDAELYAAGIFFAAAVVLLFRRTAPALKFFLLCGLIAYLPFSNLFILIGTIMGDRLMYFPSWAFCFGLSYSIQAVIIRLTDGGVRATPAAVGISTDGGVCATTAVADGSDRAASAAAAEQSGRSAWIYYAAIAALVLPLSVQTLRYNAIWRDQYTLFAHAEALYPESFQIQKNLAYALMRLDPPQLERALAHAEKCRALAPDDTVNLNNIGTIQYRLGRFDAARTAYREALGAFERGGAGRRWPGLHYNLGNAEFQLGNYAAADKHYRLALEQGADNAEQIRGRLRLARERMPQAPQAPGP